MFCADLAQLFEFVTGVGELVERRGQGDDEGGGAGDAGARRGF